MENLARHVVKYAQQLAREVSARALVLYADAIPRDDDLSCRLLPVRWTSQPSLSLGRRRLGFPPASPPTPGSPFPT